MCCFVISASGRTTPLPSSPPRSVAHLEKRANLLPHEFKVVDAALGRECFERLHRRRWPASHGHVKHAAELCKGLERRVAQVPVDRARGPLLLDGERVAEQPIQPRTAVLGQAVGLSKLRGVRVQRLPWPVSGGLRGLPQQRHPLRAREAMQVHIVEPQHYGDHVDAV